VTETLCDTTQENRLNTTEATAVDSLLRFLLDPHDLDPERSVEARENAVFLADRANHALSAGIITGRQVEAGWDVIANGCAEGCETCTAAGNAS
jgi:hypothetical protein